MSYSDDKTNAELAKLEKRLTEEYEKAYIEMKIKADKYFEDFQDRYDREYEKYKQGMYTDLEFKNWVQTQLARGIGWDKLKNNMAERMVKANEIAVAYINDKTPSIFSLNANYEAYEISKDYKNISFDIYNEEAVKNLIKDNKNHIEFKTVGLNRKRDYAWNSRQIQSALIGGIMQGKSVYELADSFMTVMQRNRTAAIRNARTAVTSAQNGGTLSTMRKARDMGIEIRKKWDSSHDGRVRDSHAHLDGQIRDLDEPFDNGLMHPADANGAPAEVYNCRCVLHHIYPKYDKNVVSNESYKEWEKQQEVVKAEKARKKKENLSKEYLDLVKKYGLNIPQDFREYEKLRKSADYSIFKGYLRAIDNNHIDALAGFDLYYNTFKKAESELVGITTKDGIKINSISIHLTERIIGYHVGTSRERLGIEIDKIIKTLTSENSTALNPEYRNGRRGQVYALDRVKATINPDDGRIIQVNPIRKGRYDNK